uniref:G-protein coupled receptors family 2 profile 2 domain-containing protein n=1 Tax=Salarias fasciatus TaxID=181472 RepID=A0A672J784_SALFA
MFWDLQMNDRRGGWNSSGCETNVSASQTRCLCDHLTHFGLLLVSSVSENDAKILTIISYLGCGVSSIFLTITVLTHLYFEKLRKDYPSKILINLSIALLLLGLAFLVNSPLSSFSNYGLCISTAALLHYFLLASFTWMGLEAVHMYLALIRVFNAYVRLYLLKFCVVGWGLPLVFVSLVLAINKDAYGDVHCWIEEDPFFYATVAYIALILLGNVILFILVLIQIRQTSSNKPFATKRNTLQDLRAVASLSVLLGFTWISGLFTMGPGRMVMMYLLVIFSSLQGKRKSQLYCIKSILCITLFLCDFGKMSRYSTSYIFIGFRMFDIECSKVVNDS